MTNKIKIGTKVTVGEDTQKQRKEFTNGLLCFDFAMIIVNIYC